MQIPTVENETHAHTHTHAHLFGTKGKHLTDKIFSWWGGGYRKVTVCAWDTGITLLPQVTAALCDTQLQPADVISDV